MHTWGPLFLPNMTATVAEAKAVDMVEAMDVVDMVEVVEAVEVETATRVSAPIAKLTVIPQMHAEEGNVLRRKITAEERTSAYVTSVGYQAMSKLIVSPTNV
jgi:hypothetical protein